MEEKQTLEEVTPEALQAEKEQKSRRRFLGLFVIIDIALFAILIYEIIARAMRAR